MNQLAGSTIQEQTRQALINCQNILRAAGAALDDVVEVQVLLTRPNDFAGLNEEYVEFFPTNPPAAAVPHRATIAAQPCHKRVQNSSTRVGIIRQWE